jgi:hypothetical protein
MAVVRKGKSPIYGIKGIKPALKPELESLKPELPESEADDDDEDVDTVIAEAIGLEGAQDGPGLDRDYKRRRNAILDIKLKTDALRLARAQGEVIPTRLVEQQLSFFLVPIRQTLLSLSHNVGSRFGRQGINREVVDYIDQIARRALEDLSKLPETIEPAAFREWLEAEEKKEKRRST